MTAALVQANIQNLRRQVRECLLIAQETRRQMRGQQQLLRLIEGSKTLHERWPELSLTDAIDLILTIEERPLTTGEITSLLVERQHPSVVQAANAVDLVGNTMRQNKVTFNWRPGSRTWTRKGRS